MVARNDTDIAALQFQNLTVNRNTDRDALQQAVNAASASGAEIAAEGVCDPVMISDSQNIQLNGVTVDASGDETGLAAFASSIEITDSTFQGIATSYNLAVTDTTSASLEDVIVNGTVYGEKGASYRTENLTVDQVELSNGASFQGAGLYIPTPAPGGRAVSISNGASMQVDDGNIEGVIVLDGNSNLELRPEVGQSITVSGGINMFRNSSMNAQGSEGSVDVQGNLIIYSGSSAGFGDGATYSNGFALIRFNSDLTLFNLRDAGGYLGFNPIALNIKYGSGVRTAGPSMNTEEEGNTVPFYDFGVVCDATSWSFGDVACP